MNSEGEFITAGGLASKNCSPCEGGTEPLAQEVASALLDRLEGWIFGSASEIVRKFKFGDFKQAMDFVNRVAEIAENEGHHPDIYVRYNRVALTLSTHAIGGLSENDFILAAKIDRLVRG